MKNDTILIRRDCILLNRSFQIKNDAAYSFLWPFLEKENLITFDEMVNEGVSIEKIKKLEKDLGHILSFTTEEWTIKRAMSVVKKKGSCRLCGQPIDYRCYITNRENEEEIYVGGTCRKAFSKDAEARFLSDYESLKELENRDKINVNHAFLSDEYNERNFLNNQKTIVLKNFEDAYNKLHTDYRRSYRRIIKSYNEKNIKKAVDLYEQVQELKREIVNNCNDLLSNEFVVTKEFLAYLKTNKMFVNTIETSKQNGVPAPYTIHSIKFEPFLRVFEKKFNELYKNELTISFLDQGMVSFIIKFNYMDVHLVLENRVILETFDKTIISKKDNEFLKRKLKLFVSKINSVNNVLNKKELKRYFEKVLNIRSIDITVLNSKNHKYNDYIYEELKEKSIYQMDGNIYIMDDLEILKEAIIYLNGKKVKTLINLSKEKRNIVKNYNSIKHLKETLQEKHEISRSLK